MFLMGTPIFVQFKHQKNKGFRNRNYDCFNFFCTSFSRALFICYRHYVETNTSMVLSPFIKKQNTYLTNVKNIRSRTGFP